MTPANGRVLIKPDAPEEKSKGGILLPNPVAQQARAGTIVSSDDGNFAPNWKVLFPAGVGVSTPEGELIEGKHILAVLSYGQ